MSTPTSLLRPAPTPLPAPVAVRPRAWTAVAASIATVAWGGNEFTPLLVMYRELSGFGPVTVDALLAAYVLGIVPALLLGGPLSDLHGRRPLLLPAAPLSLAGSVLLSLGAGSPLVIGIGRVLCGLALGLAMAVGTAWVSELSARAGAAAEGPRRASLSLTAGFLLGAGAAAALAQWGPWPTRTAYLLHAALTLAAGIWLLRAPETRPRPSTDAGGAVPKRGLLPLLRVPAAGHRRFLRVVAPVAPWVFGSAGTAYAVLPALLGAHAGPFPIAYAGAMTVVTLGAGVAVQTLARRLDTARSARTSVLAMAVVVLGTALAAAAARTGGLGLGFTAAAVLGAGYGIALVAGLGEVQRIADGTDLAGLTAVYYALAYTGFFVPMLLTALSARIPFPVLLTAGAVLAAATLVEVALARRAHLPSARGGYRGGHARHEDHRAAHPGAR